MRALALALLGLAPAGLAGPFAHPLTGPAPQGEDSSPAAEAAGDEATAPTTAAPGRDIGYAALRLPGRRFYRGAITVDADGEMRLDAKSFSEPAIVDWDAVESFTALDAGLNDRAAELGGQGGDVLTALRGQRLHGRVVSIGTESIGFESARFGLLSIPVEVAGDLAYVPAQTPEAALEPGPLADDPAAGSSDDSPAEADGAPESNARDLALPGRWAAWKNGSKPGTAEVRAGTLRLRSDDARVWRQISARDSFVTIDLAWLGAPEFAIVIDGAPTDPDYLKAGPGDRRTGVTIEPWQGRLTMLRWVDGEVEAVQSADELPLDGLGLLRFRVTEDEVALSDFEGADGTRFEFDLRMGRTAPADARERASIEILCQGRPMRLHDVMVEGEEVLRDELGRLLLDRRLRSAEVLGFDPEAREIEVERGVAAFESTQGVQFLHRSRNDELFTARAEAGFGRIVMADSETVEVDGVAFRDGMFLVRPRWNDQTVEVAPADVIDIQLNNARSQASPDAFEYRLGSGKSQTAGFNGIVLKDGKPFLQRKEPGFKNVISAEIDESLLLKRGTRSMFHVSRRKYPHELVLTDRQSFPARLVSVTAETLTVKTPFSRDEVELRQDDVKAILFNATTTDTLLAALSAPEKKETNNQVFIVRGGGGNTKPDPSLVTKERLDRALQVLRTQKDDPGTHLLVANNGDLLRTNLQSIEGETLKVDGGAGGALEVPMNLLAALVQISPDREPSSFDEDPWTVVFNARATLRMRLLSNANGSLVFQHAALGEVVVGSDEFELMEFARPYEPDARPYMDWVTRPISEPDLDPNR